MDANARCRRSRPPKLFDFSNKKADFLQALFIMFGGILIYGITYLFIGILYSKLKKEYLEVNKSIDIRFRGIHDENSTLIYKVWEEIPDGKTPINNYSFIHKN